MGKRVIVMPYDESWKQAFEDIRKEIAEALGVLALRIEHVGSTSVEGLSAKPIIDIDVVIKAVGRAAARHRQARHQTLRREDRLDFPRTRGARSQDGERHFP